MDIYLYLLPDVFQLPVNCVINVIQLYLLHLLGGNYRLLKCTKRPVYVYRHNISTIGVFFLQILPFF